MKISSSCSTSCFDFALDYLVWLDKTLRYELCTDIWNLKMEVGLLKTFDLYLRKCRKCRSCLEEDEEEKGIISCRIQDLIISSTQDLEFAYRKYFVHSRLPGLSEIKSELVIFQEAIKLFFETDIKESCINFLLDCYWLGDPRLVMDFINSVSENVEDLLHRKHTFRQALIVLVRTLQEKLMFLKTFIRFAILHSVEGEQLIDLLIHAEVVAINAARLISICWFERDDEHVCSEVEIEISGLINEKINPRDPQVLETYIYVLTASKSSISSDTSALDKNRHLVAGFIDCLTNSLMELLDSCTSFLVPLVDQKLKLHKGVTFLGILLRQQEKFDQLRDEMKNLIGVLVCDIGMVIFSLSGNEMKEGLAKQTDLALFHLLKVLKFVMAEVSQVYPLASVSTFGFPRTNELGSMDYLLKNLRELATCNRADDSIAFQKDQILIVLEDLVFLRSILGKIVKQRYQNEKLQALWSRVMEVAYRAEFVIDSIVVGGDKHEYLESVARDIQLVKTEAIESYDSIRHHSEAQRMNQKSFHMESQIHTSTMNEVLVGLDDEVKTMIDILTRGSKQLDIVSIVGMPGLGKTTFANRVYNEPTILSHFHVRAWCTVSQIYRKKNLLVQIFRCIVSSSPDQNLKMNEDDLADKLYKHLKGYRYLIILDDVWDIGAWNLLNNSFPDDANGSRILFTSRFQNLSSQFKLGSKPYHLRPLTNAESWELLQNKLFGREGCPPKLSKVGLRITKKCKGLPFMVVLVAGILATTEQDCWNEIIETLSSGTVIETEECKRTSELSYSHLPDHLKPCLLYFGAFQEDQDIPIRRLLWIWISEGFVTETEGKSLEDVADDYLMDLLGRSLVMVTQKRSLGGAKSCRLHDLVHEFCVAKAKEESFVQILHGLNDRYTITGPCIPHRFCIYSANVRELKKSTLFFPNLRCLLFFPPNSWMFEVLRDCSLGFVSLKLLRVLDLGDIDHGRIFPMEVILLVHLRYLAIQSEVESIPSAIGNLSRLETFLLNVCTTDVALPNAIWNIKTLRHLCITGSHYGFSLSIDNLEISPDLDDLHTFTLAIDPSSQSLEKILTKLPSIRRLRCVRAIRARESTQCCNEILVLDCLNRLESLKVGRFDGYQLVFPLNLKKLTLFSNHQPWSEISTIGKLPNLEVLNLCYESFVGEHWEMKEGEFCNLRFLKLSKLDICRWTASSDNFSCLEKLVLHFCMGLEEIPSCLGDSPTLEMIEVTFCHKSTVSSVKQIQQEQMDMGNQDLKVVIGHQWDPSNSSSDEFLSESDSDSSEAEPDSIGE